jgi:hypothetical protein
VSTSIGLSLLIEARHRAQARGIGFAVATDRRAVLRPPERDPVIDLIVLRAGSTKPVRRPWRETVKRAALARSRW